MAEMDSARVQQRSPIVLVTVLATLLILEASHDRWAALLRARGLTLHATRVYTNDLTRACLFALNLNVLPPYCTFTAREHGFGYLVTASVAHDPFEERPIASDITTTGLWLPRAALETIVLHERDVPLSLQIPSVGWTFCLCSASVDIATGWAVTSTRPCPHSASLTQYCLQKQPAGTAERADLTHIATEPGPSLSHGYTPRATLAQLRRGAFAPQIEHESRPLIRSLSAAPVALNHHQVWDTSALVTRLDSLRGIGYIVVAGDLELKGPVSLDYPSFLMVGGQLRAEGPCVIRGHLITQTSAAHPTCQVLGRRSLAGPYRMNALDMLDGLSAASLLYLDTTSWLTRINHFHDLEPSLRPRPRVHSQPPADLWTESQGVSHNPNEPYVLIYLEEDHRTTEHRSDPSGYERGL
jgi:hypothetical protein